MGGSVAVFAKGDYQSAHFGASFQAQVNLEVTEKRWPGIVPLLEKGMQYGEAWRDELNRYRQTMDCPACHGQRLAPEALAVKIDGLSIADFCALSIDKEIAWLRSRTFTGRWAVIADALLKELETAMLEASDRLEFERAAALRDQMRAVRQTVERQAAVLPGGGDMDAVGLSPSDRGLALAVVFVRQGAVQGAGKLSEDVVFNEREAIEEVADIHVGFFPVPAKARTPEVLDEDEAAGARQRM